MNMGHFVICAAQNPSPGTSKPSNQWDPSHSALLVRAREHKDWCPLTLKFLKQGHGSSNIKKSSFLVDTRTP